MLIQVYTKELTGKVNTILLLLFHFAIAVNVNAQQVFKISSGTIFKTTGNVIITLQDMDLVTDAPILQLTGEGTFRFNGSSSNTISGTSIPLFNQMELAKTGSGRINLQQSIRIGMSLNFISGLLDIGSAQVQLEPTALLLNEQQNSRITTTGNGTVRITTSLSAPASVNPGNLGAIISSTQNLGAVTVARGHAAINLPVVGRPTIHRTYEFTVANNNQLNATLRFQYFDAELNGRTENQLSLWRSNDNTTWNGAGFTLRDDASNYIQLNNVAVITKWWSATDISFPTSVFDLLPENKTHTLWPNPVSADHPVYLKLSAAKRTDADLRVMDVNGRILFQQPLQLMKGINTISFPVANLPKGAYQVQVLAEGGFTILSRFIKQ